VFIEGRLELRKYTGNDGTQRISVDVIASDMEMLDPKEPGSAGNYAASSSSTRSSAPTDDYDPFLDPDELP